MLPKMQGSHFIKKYSVQFVGASGRLSEPFYFVDHKPHPSSQTWQVRRSEFDQMHAGERPRAWRRRARGRAGAGGFVRGGPGCRRADSGCRGGRADRAGLVVVDASGQSSMIMSRLGLREWDPVLKKAALWTYWKGAYRDTGRDEGATIVLQIEAKQGWFWYIPLHDDIVSVGVVASYEYLFKNRADKDHETIYCEEVDRCAGVKDPIRQCRVRHAFLCRQGILVSLAAGGRRRLGAGRRRVRLPRPALFFRRALGAEIRPVGGRRGDRRAGCAATPRRPLGKWEPDFVSGMDRMRRLVCEYYDGFSFGRVRQAPSGVQRPSDRSADRRPVQRQPGRGFRPDRCDESPSLPQQTGLSAAPPRLPDTRWPQASQFAPAPPAGAARTLLVYLTMVAEPCWHFWPIRPLRRNVRAAAARPAARRLTRPIATLLPRATPPSPVPAACWGMSCWHWRPRLSLGNCWAGCSCSFGQPPVIGEVVAGILLGPSLLGCVSPEAAALVASARRRARTGACSASSASSCTCSWSAWNSTAGLLARRVTRR